MNPEDVISLVTQHKWIALVAMGIGLVVRLLKSDTTIPLDIPPRWRVWAALGLGAASGAVDKLVAAGSTTWGRALTEGLIAAVVAIVSHNLFVASVRGGREFVIPGLTKVGVSPGPGRPVSIKPPPAPPAP